MDLNTVLYILAAVLCVILIVYIYIDTKKDFK